MSNEELYADSEHVWDPNEIIVIGDKFDGMPNVSNWMRFGIQVSMYADVDIHQGYFKLDNDSD